MNSPNLSTARRALDRANDALQAKMLSPEVRGPKEQNFTRDSEAWNNLYYSSSTASALVGRFWKFHEFDSKRAALVRAEFDAAVAAWSEYDIARLAEKARLTEKRAARTAKADLNARLNLQPGVSLNGVDVGQYEVILAGLEPVRAHVYSARKTMLRKEQARQIDALVAHDWNAALAFPDRLHNLRFPNRPMASLPEHFNLFFAYGHTVCLREDVAARIDAEAKQFALAYVQGYAAKLAVKTGEVIANDFAGFAPVLCWVTSNDLWRNSVAYIKLHDASKAEVVLTFHTQIIWNRSCLGKVFNQYPTRRV